MGWGRDLVNEVENGSLPYIKVGPSPVSGAVIGNLGFIRPSRSRFSAGHGGVVIHTFREGVRALELETGLEPPSYTHLKRIVIGNAVLGEVIGLAQGTISALAHDRHKGPPIHLGGK